MFAVLATATDMLHSKVTEDSDVQFLLKKQES